MTVYLYYCPECDHSFEVKKAMAESGQVEFCQKCDSQAIRRYTAIPALFGWRLTAESHHIRGHPDELERDI